jgi:hypothetical protein
MKMNLCRTLPVVAVMAVVLSCGGSPTPTTPPSPPTPSIAPTTITSPSPIPSATPGAAACRYGKGTVSTYCARQVSAFGAEVDAAITLLTQEHPEIFDLNSRVGDGGFRVLDTDAYYAGVIRNLEARDFCAGYDLVDLQVKNSSSFSEQHDILLASGHIRRGPGSYRSTCSPPNFPLDPEDLIDRVRVGFFGIRCDPGITPPRNGEDKLYIGCTGSVTASPKNKDGHDVDPRIHGDRIEWTLTQESFVVEFEDVPGVAFNKILTAESTGHFTVCADVKGVEGCMHGEVVVAP